MQFNKKMSKGGAVTLPAAMRRELGIDSGEKFSILTNQDGTITLKRIQGQCLFCKTETKLLVFEGRFVCSECIAQMSKEGAKLWNSH